MYSGLNRFNNNYNSKVFLILQRTCIMHFELEKRVFGEKIEFILTTGMPFVFLSVRKCLRDPRRFYSLFLYFYFHDNDIQYHNYRTQAF